MDKREKTNSPGTVDSSTSERLQLVSFRLGSEEFGVNILEVQEIIRVAEITRVPQTPPFVEGVINLRGRVVPIIDLRKRLGFEAAEHDKNTRIVVVTIDGNILGMVVDSVSEVLRVPLTAIEPPPDFIVSGVEAELITGVAKLEDRLLMSLDLSKIIGTVEMAGIIG